MKRVKDTVARIDPQAKTATLASGTSIRYDKLVLSPGIELMWDSIEGLKAARDQGRILQAWKAGPETVALRRQPELLQRFAVELQHDLVRRCDEAHALCEFEVVAVSEFAEALARRQFMVPEAAMLDIGFELARVHRAAASFIALLSPPSRQRPDAG